MLFACLMIGGYLIMEDNMIIGDNWLRIDRHYDNTYRVVNRSGKELAAKLTRKDANAMCCAMCVPSLNEDYDDKQPVWLSFQDNLYKVTPPRYVPEWHEIKIGIVADVRKWHDILATRDV
jgi:hypothetical protein